MSLYQPTPNLARGNRSPALAKPYASLCTLVLLAMTTTAVADEALDAAFERDVLVVIASAHACHRFDAYLAMNSEQQRRGLMFVRELPTTTGMLFVYEQERTLSIWMKNTYIPLDVIFMRANGRVINIHHAAEPQSLRSMRSAEPAVYVLEVNAGVAEDYAIEPGSQVLWGPTYNAD